MSSGDKIFIGIMLFFVGAGISTFFVGTGDSTYKTTAKMCHIQCLEKDYHKWELFDNLDETGTIRLLECYCYNSLKSEHLFTKRSK